MTLMSGLGLLEVGDDLIEAVLFGAAGDGCVNAQLGLRHCSSGRHQERYGSRRQRKLQSLHALHPLFPKGPALRGAPC